MKWKIVQALRPKNLQRDQLQGTKKIRYESKRFRGEEEQKPWLNLWNITVFNEKLLTNGKQLKLTRNLK